MQSNVRSTERALVIEGLQLLAVQLKDVTVCATMVRLQWLQLRCHLVAVDVLLLCSS